MNEPKYIFFNDAGLISSGKTKIWWVVPKENSDEPLGQVKWFGAWRCYAFYPFKETVFEKQCLRDIANFCEEQTILQRRKAV